MPEATRNCLRIGLAAILSWCAGAPACSGGKKAAEGERIAYGPGRLVCHLANEAINESSGLAASRRTSGVFWTHNDSGGAPVLYAFDTKGRDLATIRIGGATARDWEDMASFRRGARSYLLIGDVGDNGYVRPSATLYIVPEPRVDPKRRGVKAKVDVARTIRFRYEGGPRNCESVAVDPADGTILLVSKESTPPCDVFALRWPKQPTRHALLARRIAALNIPVATAMDISPDGRRAVILTFVHAYEYTRAPAEKWSKAFARKPAAIRLPSRRQGESICYGPDGKTLYLTSEKLPTPLIEIPVVPEKK